MNRSIHTIKTAVTALSVLLILLLLPMGCGQPRVPENNVEKSAAIPSINPDYTDIVIPFNIAPMNFEIEIPGEEYISRVTGKNGKTITVKGKIVKWNMKAWHKLLEESKGGILEYDIYIKDNSGKWIQYSFTNKVASEPIDPYISYRLIEPSYMHFSGMTINQRDLTSFKESVIFNNATPTDERRGFCINCHVPRNNYKDGSSQFHVRQFNGGTIVMAGDSVRKVNLKTDSTISAGVYPAWHPTLDLIAYSTNDTHQQFFAFGDNRVEVYDKKSDLILYDMKTHEIMNIANDQDLMETFPAWHPDGKKIYYSVARYPEGVSPETVADNFAKIQYDIVSRDFDIATRNFSEPDTVVYVSGDNQSALLPRISPDGHFLLYCKAPYGTFHIWHKDSDLYIKDLKTGEERRLQNANSDDTDSYHTWSSNSRWVVFSSRRDDGSYTRPYITYISPDGKDSKAFIVPQETPDYYRQLVKSYNVPEFMLGPVEVKRSSIVEAFKKDACAVSFRR